MNLLNNLKNIVFVLLAFTIPVSVAFTNVFLVVFLIVWLLEGDFIRKIHVFKSNKWLWSVLVLTIMYFLGLMYGHNHNDANYVLQRVSLLLMFIVFTTAEIRQKSYHYALTLFLFTNLISATVSILINNEIIEPISSYIPIVSSENSISAFLKYNYHNILLSFSSLLSFMLFHLSKNKYSFLYLLAIPIFCLSIFSEAGRAGQLTINVFMFFYAIYFLRSKIKYSISIFFFLILVNYSSYNNSTVFKYRVDQLNHVVQNNGEKKNPKAKEKDIRYLFLNESLSLIKERPFFGHGSGSFSSILISNTNSSYDFEKHKTPHNNFLYVFFELGIFGFLIFLSIFYYQIKSILKNSNMKIHSINLPLFYLFLMLFDSYLFIFTITVMYMFMYKIFSEIDLKFKKRLLQ
jgi:O-antigen ligase